MACNYYTGLAPPRQTLAARIGVMLCMSPGPFSPVVLISIPWAADFSHGRAVEFAQYVDESIVLG